MVTASLEGLTLHVGDLERSLEFYQKVPGAHVAVHLPGVFAMLQIGTARLGLLAHPQNRGNRGFHLEVEAEDLGAMYAQLQAAGIEPETPPQKKAQGGMEFMVADPDGNFVEFAETHD